MARFLLPLALALYVLSLSEADVLIRKNVNSLSDEDTLNLQKALRAVSISTDPNKNYQALAKYHGYPGSCTYHGQPIACCIHGMAVFPQWHRMYTATLEQAMKENGLTIGIPYWDWTQPLHSLPNLVNEQVFIESDGGKARKNVWYQGDIDIDGETHHTARAVDARLFQKVHAGEKSDLFEGVLNALEYENYCQFEVQFEVAHNTIHYLVGGRNTYSMSHLEYTSYDPIFFLHHSNVDRLYNIYEELQKLRGHSPGDCHGACELCDVKMFQKPLEPFSWDSFPYEVIKQASVAMKAHDINSFGYNYDSLSLNGYTVKDIEKMLKERASHDRAFANFRLKGIGFSANVRVSVCKPPTDKVFHDFTSDYCQFAGDFFILGGPLEMPWSFSRPYYFEITKTVQEMGLPLDGDYFIKAELYNVNGTKMDSGMLPNPYVHYRPAAGKKDPAIGHDEVGHEHDFHVNVAVRKDVDRLTREEVTEIRDALGKFMADRSVDGYQAIAEFHGEPGKCPYPTAKNRMACCIHGMPTFPQWHRLLVVQVEDALRRRGSHIGIPYWDWTKRNSHIPLLASDHDYIDPDSHESVHNPFHHAEIAFLPNDVKTTRNVSSTLSQVPAYGDHTELFDEFLLALEQDNFCDFEVQFEVAHNLIHGLVGGSSKYGLATLSYSAFDPIFYLHHSNVDRIWAIWTALQQYRGKPYKAHCANSYTYRPLKPFAFASPFNNNEKTFSHSVPLNIYDYEEELGYTYDSLEFGGMRIPELEDYINTNLRSKSRTFVGVLLHGIQVSAMAHIYISAPSLAKYDAGRFALLGGPTEMAWQFDRTYRHDITEALETLGLEWNGEYDVTLEMTQFDGTPIDVSQFPVQVIHKDKEPPADASKIETRVRKNVNSLNKEEILALRHALAELQADKSNGGFQDLGRYHGTPKWCPTPDADVKKSCCLHGMPTFPHWHRLWTVQAENALRRHGYKGGIPYWDWNLPMTKLPDLVTEEVYVDPATDSNTPNPFFSAHIDDVDANTVRSVRQEIFEQPNFGEYTQIAKQVFLALEQEDFCTFEVQYEIAHNFIHALVGGNEQYSMASLMYTAFDPLFYLHHSNTDRIWAIWQGLQKYRGKPYNSANCAIDRLRKPLSPFSLSHDVNPDRMTSENSVPTRVFDYRNNFHYEYDNLEFNGLTIPQLARELKKNKGHDRVFAGFMLHGIKRSALVRFRICRSANDCSGIAGEFYILGDSNEMDWSYDRLYKYEITDQLEKENLHYNDRYFISYEVLNLQGEVISTDEFQTPTVLFEVGTNKLYGKEYRESVTTVSHVRRDLHTLSVGEVESLRAAFLAMQNDGVYMDIASFHGQPGLCDLDGHKIACCVHGMPTFPAWHRLYVEQVEEALLDRGSSVAVPYWDWTKPISELPKLISEATYFNSRKQRFDANPFFSGHIKGEDAVTTRDPQPELFNNDNLYEQVLFALEQNNFCDFEIQFEIVHNALHFFLGGRAKYSMSSLDYSAFDPVFFLHHSNTDRIWAIWQELQRYRGLPYNEADCAINLMRKPLRPFYERTNASDLTHKYSRPADTFDYRNHFHYAYDTLSLNGMNIPQLDHLLHERQEHGRIFAGFLLHNIGLSADVEIYICVPTGPRGAKNCDKKAGEFYILGGELEMPFTFDRLYKHDITHAVEELGLKPDSAANFDLKINVKAANGSELNPDLLPPPSTFYVVGTEHRQEADGQVSNYVVRKEITALSPREILSLQRAMRSLQEDSSADGWQSIAAFHAIPALCPSPTAFTRYACCLHGMATFPQWHRLYTVQVEDALRRHGALVGIPYWDWTRVSNHLPSLISDETLTDPFTKEVEPNPWFKAKIEFEHSETERDVQSHLYERGPHGWDTWLFKQVLFALEQEDFCDFEIQLEVTHNAIHSWLGGSKVHSMGHLHYASYDPAFFVHHSNTDRLWALWQKLQEYRGHNPNVTNCALEQMKVPLRPFSFGPPYNLNQLTKEFSKPEDTFEYEDHLHYHYDTLEFVGMSIPQLDDFIKERQEKDRVFAGFLLKGSGKSTIVKFRICKDGECFDGGYFTVLGGEMEMPWQFDRLFKYEITDVLDEHSIRHDDEYSIDVTVTLNDGTPVTDAIPTSSVILVQAKTNFHVESVTTNYVRRNLNTLEERDIQSLQAALSDLQHDDSREGWAALASFHGAPNRCPDPDNPTHACCLHGMPTFPHWHRLFTLQVEHALQSHGSAVAIPYWDWSVAFDDLPDIFNKPDFYNVWRDEVIDNPFAHGYVKSENAWTVRDKREELTWKMPDGKHSNLFPLILSALEQTDYCDFEVQFEVMHNAIHFLVGGHQTYSLSSLEYSAYDPIFFIHHSFVDKIWAVWQELQKRRRLPYDRADCAVSFMSQPMQPFYFEDFNPNQFTKDHAVPNTLFNYEDLHYHYDNLDIGGYTIEELEHLIEEMQDKPRVFAGFLLKGIETSGTVEISICPRDKDCVYAGFFNLLGGPTEMHWAFDRLYKRDITAALESAGIHAEDVREVGTAFTLQVKASDVEGLSLPLSSVMPEPSLIYEPAHGHEEPDDADHVDGVAVRKDVSSLTEAEVENLRHALQKVMDDDGPNGFQSIAAFHGSPASCEYEGHPIACCLHGMANFPQWHRLYTKQWEDALVAQGAEVGIPYWDWTTAFTELPHLVTDEDDHDGHHNPFHHGLIYNGEKTTRSPRDMLFNDPESGSESFFYRQVLLAFEQTDYCDFEVQYEITHNAIHSWTGGTSKYGMSTLEYTAYDPLFLLHHSNVDRQFAIWQALQKFRKMPYNSANCAIQHLRKPMRPFSDETNKNPVTRANSKAIDAFDYHRFNYQYDNLNFHGLTISQLNDILEERKHHDRIFAEFLLHGIDASADVTFDLCKDVKEGEEKQCKFAGTFAILGGPLEMPWSFDRLFKYDVTKAFNALGLRPDSAYHFHVHIVAINGTELDHDLIRSPSVQFVPATGDHIHAVQTTDAPKSDKLIRKDINSLSLDESANLRNALSQLKQDHGPNGFEAIAGFHGYPYRCPETGDDHYACCVHGMPVFPHWHRLLTVQFEQALKEKGALVGIPFWDWVAPVKALPSLFGDNSSSNPFLSSFISGENTETTREIQSEMFNPHTIGQYNYLYYLALSTLEEDSYCDFEVQFEILHNEVHALIGGRAKYSMATLDFSAFDPFFMIHHSSIDRIWVIWQELQKLRHKPFSAAQCAGHIMEQPLQPFSYPDVNVNEKTRINSIPNLIFDASRFGYEYDDLHLNGLSVDQIKHKIEELRATDRIYFAIALHGEEASLEINLSVTDKDGKSNHAGRFHLLGGAKEMPWAYERLFKYDITDIMTATHLDTDHPVQVTLQAYNYDHTPRPSNSKTYYALLVERMANTDHDVVVIPVGGNADNLPPKIVLKKGTHIKFVDTNVGAPIWEDLGSYTSFTKCSIPLFSYHTYELGVVHALSPGSYFFVPKNTTSCMAGKRIQITVDEH